MSTSGVEFEDSISSDSDIMSVHDCDSDSSDSMSTSKVDFNDSVFSDSNSESAHDRDSDSSANSISSDSDIMSVHDADLDFIYLDDNSNDDGDYSSDSSDEEEISTFCKNCKRRECDQVINKFGDFYSISFVRHNMNDIKRQKQFNHIKKRSNRQDNDRIFWLCKSCSSLLCGENEKESETWINSWPSFIWAMLKDVKVREKYGDLVWKFLPEPWRYWWIASSQKYYPSITILKPMPMFLDLTLGIMDWDQNIQSNVISNVAKVCNKYLLPTVLCPWGCSEFLHRSAFLDIDIVFQRFLPKCIIKIWNDKKKLLKVKSCRDDYIRFYDEYDMWLLNSNWKVMPSITFVNNQGPRIMVCRDHNGGTPRLMIHPLRQPHHILPSPHPDQLCHCVIKSRTIKQLKASHYSNTFQMHEQRGTFNGIDTCSITNCGQFDFTSRLLHESECKSIMFRPDINGLLSQLCEE